MSQYDHLFMKEVSPLLTFLLKTSETGTYFPTRCCCILATSSTRKIEIKNLLKWLCGPTNLLHYYEISHTKILTQAKLFARTLTSPLVDIDPERPTFTRKIEIKHLCHHFEFLKSCCHKSLVLASGDLPYYYQT